MNVSLIMPENGVLSIAPADINCNGHFWDAFGNSETEISAKYVVRLCQQKGGWTPFSDEEIEEFYFEKSGHHGYSFNRLVEPGWAYGLGERKLVGGGWVLRGADGLYRVTVEFVLRCYMSTKKN